MDFIETSLKGAYIIQPKLLNDERGYFARIFCKKEFEAIGVKTEMVQSNTSYSKNKFTLRGMHYQIEDAQEAKLIRCTQGIIWDVIIDIRRGSETYCQYLGVELSLENQKMMYVPEGFAHGFMTLESHSIVSYQVSNYYNQQKERGIRWNDSLFNINWQTNSPFISEKDANHPDFKID